MLTFGKHRGRSFEEMKKVDPAYCNWVRTLKAPGKLKEFCLYLNKLGDYKTCENGCGCCDLCDAKKNMSFVNDDIEQKVREIHENILIKTAVQTRGIVPSTKRDQIEETYRFCTFCEDHREVIDGYDLLLCISCGGIFILEN